MALVAGNWYTITIGALSTGTNPLPRMEGAVLDAIDTGSPMLVFCDNDSLGGGTLARIHYEGGVSLVQHTMTTITSTPTKLVSPMDDGDTWTSVRRGDGKWLFFSESAGAIRSMDPADQAALKAFI